ncbi:MAG: hypothetical protein CVU44_11240 [Chloroflexi bacterium HGW-Chloroflexi-6]|nr:MAG: hypothetical protein CVU44_11240 [Chloroflexi bacterium HGW-Chloroflexi-6]
MHEPVSKEQHDKPMAKKKLKTYMVYSRFLTPSEGALLVFAHNVQEARTVGWRATSGADLTDDYLDFAASLLKGCDWLFAETSQEKLDQDFPHLVWDIKSCDECEKWGHSPIGDDGLCDECREERSRTRE